MRRARALGDLPLRELELVAAFADVRGDPVDLAQPLDYGVFLARGAIAVAAPRAGRGGS
jgi:hypothetical protein